MWIKTSFAILFSLKFDKTERTKLADDFVYLTWSKVTENKDLTWVLMKYVMSSKSPSGGVKNILELSSYISKLTH